MKKQNSIGELGKKTKYSNQYNPKLLFPIPRKNKRAEIGLNQRNKLPFKGVDAWNAYEISWLNQKDCPQVGVLELIVPANSSYIVESKSLKLYFNSFNQSRFKTKTAVQAIIKKDLEQILKIKVKVKIFNPGKMPFVKFNQNKFSCLDQLKLKEVTFTYSANLIKKGKKTKVKKSLVSHLLKSNCLVTNQPDWATLYIKYEGHEIDEKSLLRYIISFREHNEFHEQCVERIFCDLMQTGLIKKLTVYARYTRRGGIDINPFRSNFEKFWGNFYSYRQ